MVKSMQGFESIQGLVTSDVEVHLKHRLECDDVENVVVYYEDAISLFAWAFLLFLLDDALNGEHK